MINDRVLRSGSFWNQQKRDRQTYQAHRHQDGDEGEGPGLAGSVGQLLELLDALDVLRRPSGAAPRAGRRRCASAAATSTEIGERHLAVLVVRGDRVDHDLGSRRTSAPTSAPISGCVPSRS